MVIIEEPVDMEKVNNIHLSSDLRKTNNVGKQLEDSDQPGHQLSL